jgi:hypothetical protein
LTGFGSSKDTNNGCCYYRAAEYLVRTGPTATLEVAKQGAIYHGLATLLQQPSPVMGRGKANHVTCFLYCTLLHILKRKIFMLVDCRNSCFCFMCLYMDIQRNGLYMDIQRIG